VFAELHDISVTVATQSITYPGDTPFQRSLLSELEAGAPFELSRVEMSAHLGTHIDAPAHFVTDGKRITDFAAADFVFPAHVVDIPGDGQVGVAAIADVDAQPGDALLLRTENSRSGRCRAGVFASDWVSVGADAANWCAEHELGLVGIDYISIDGFDDTGYPAHHAILGAGALVLEGIDLSAIIPGCYTLLCFPLKIEAVEASPVRAVLAR
jgi:arylformamidase